MGLEVKPVISRGCQDLGVVPGLGEVFVSGVSEYWGTAHTLLSDGAFEHERTVLLGR